MTNQTLDYISLKPLADRFRAVADSITDEEIGQIIRQESERKFVSSWSWILHLRHIWKILLMSGFQIQTTTIIA